MLSLFKILHWVDIMVAYGFDYAGRQLEKTIADMEDLATLIGEVKSESIELNSGTKLCPGLGMIAEAEEIKTKINDLREGIFTVLVLGRLFNGVTTLLNSILVDNTLIEKNRLISTIIRKTVYGTDEFIKIYTENQNEPQKVSISEFKEKYALNLDYFVDDNPSKFKDLKYAQIETSSPLCKNGIQFIEFKIEDKAFIQNPVTITYLQQAQAIIFVLRADQILSGIEIEFISNNISNRNPTNIFFVINRFEMLRKHSDRDEVIRITHRFLYPLYNDEKLYSKRVFFVSAFDALDARTQEPFDEALLEKSNIPVLEHELEEYLTSEEKLREVFLSTRKLARFIINRAYREVMNQISVLRKQHDVTSMHKKVILTQIQEKLLELSKKNQWDIFSIPEVNKINNHCSKIPHNGDIPDDLSVILNKIQKYVYRCNDPAIRISFFGSFSAGKSSLINALLDVPLLPAKANRSTGVITTVCYADDSSAQVIHNSSEKEIDINFDDRNKYILIDALGSNEYCSHEVKEVRLNIPNSLLEEGIVLVDTPGIQDDDKLTEIAFEACEYSDLVIMVLNGSRILSDTEKESINNINETLNGNIIFALNKFDSLKTEEDREEISNITSHVLRKMGNNKVGNPRIYHVVSEDIPSACDQRITTVNQLNDLREWIVNLLSSPSVKQIIWNARFSVVEKYLKELSITTDTYLNREIEIIEELDKEVKKIKRQSQHSHEKKVNSIMSIIYQVDVTLEECKSDCFDIWIQKLDAFISSNSNWDKNSDLSSSLKEETVNYCAKVNEKYSFVQRSIRDLGISIPLFDIDTSKIPISIVPVERSNYGKVCGTGAVLGGLFGGPVGLVLGGVLAAAVVSQYDSTETLNLAKSKKQDLFQFLNLHNTQYIQLLKTKIDESVPQYLPNQELSSNITAAKEKNECYSELKQWCNGFSSIIQDARTRNV